MSERLSPGPEEDTPEERDELYLVPDTLVSQKFFEHIIEFAIENNISSQDLYYLVIGMSEIFQNRFIFPEEADSGNTNSGGSVPLLEGKKNICSTIKESTIPYDPILEGSTIRILDESMHGGVAHQTNPLVDTEPIEVSDDYY